uniref:Receptor-binding cancer antigen expressed on SiSo cells n=1 Tax=Astatotilapia calliptera TaxID=8154 RepID=A0AAX7T9F8_ASTCA
MAISQFRLFKICTCLASFLSFFKRLICRTGRGRKLSGDQITLPTTVDFSSSVPKQPEIEEWSSWDEEAPTSIKIEGGNGNVSPPPNDVDEEPDYFKDMAPTIRKTQKVCLLQKNAPIPFSYSTDSVNFDTANCQFPQAELGEMDTWQEDTNAWEDESDAAWEAEEVLRQQKMAEREKRFMEQQRKKMEKEAQRMMKKEQKIAVKLS